MCKPHKCTLCDGTFALLNFCYSYKIVSKFCELYWALKCEYDTKYIITTSTMQVNTLSTLSAYLASSASMSCIKLPLNSSFNGASKIFMSANFWNQNFHVSKIIWIRIKISINFTQLKLLSQLNFHTTNFSSVNFFNTENLMCLNF